MEFNAINNQIGKLMKEKKKDEAVELQEKSKAMKDEIAAARAATADALAARDAALSPIGNLVHESVPVSSDEKDNVVVRTWGDPGPAKGKKYNHVDLVRLLDIVDLDAGVAAAGGRGYYLKKEGVLLNQALIQFAIAHGMAAGAEPVATPFFLNKEIMAETAQLSQFDEELYKVSAGSGKDGEDGGENDKYLIATSEQPLCALHRARWFDEKDLPLKYVGYSTCFRKEAGSHGRDTLGIFRVHQFEKVEQFTVTSPLNNASWEALEEMLSTAEGFYRALNLPYQVVNIVSGELNNAAAKKYDLEAWFPAGAAFRELVSCSNCTDYQSRAVEARLRVPQAPGEASAAAKREKLYVHMLNCTLAATQRTLCCVLENWQEEGGVRVPDCLRPYMPMGIDFVPFRKALDAKGKVVPLPAAAAADGEKAG
jgi:seryl-tRNA synthetase